MPSTIDPLDALLKAFATDVDVLRAAQNILERPPEDSNDPRANLCVLGAILLRRFLEKAQAKGMTVRDIEDEILRMARAQGFEG